MSANHAKAIECLPLKGVVRRQQSICHAEVRIARSFDDLLMVYSVRSAVYIAEQECPFAEEFDGNDHSNCRARRPNWCLEFVFGKRGKSTCRFMSPRRCSPRTIILSRRASRKMAQRPRSGTDARKAGNISLPPCPGRIRIGPGALRNR